ncbi:solute carrier family 15 member 5 [Tachysurus vachellii]|uniref:solute carrier family 15 member 5 n=1 Tax=Tachysurus vachellii TaxID=175792 RepID=UPI00296AC7AA|nr:solute carrier family 15 member 5 [Tachysurus vachellii]
MVALNVAGLHDGRLLEKDATTCHRRGKVIPRKPRKKVKAIICVLFVELIERFTFFGIVCNMILFCTIKLGYDSYQAATVNLCFVGASTLTPVLAGWIAETCLGRKKVFYLCALLHFFGLLAAACGIGGIRAILCPLGVNNLQGYNQKKIQSFFNWIYWLVNLNATVIFLGIAYIQQSVGKNLGFFIPFTSVLLGLIGIHMARSNLILHPRKGGSLLTTMGVFLNSLQMCCLRYRHLSGDVTDWFDRAKENNGGCYSETKVENVKILVKLFPLFGLQLLYRACITQIPSGYYLQTMHSNLNLSGVMLPIAAMNVISILPLLILAPLLEFVSICYQYLKKTPPSPVKFMIIGHVCAALSALIAGISEVHRKHYPQMDQTISGTTLQVSSMSCIHLAPQYILLGVAEAFVTPACSVISFCLTPSNLRGISLQFLTLSYGGGCFLGALLIQFFYFLSGGSFYPNTLNNGNMERFFLILAILMVINILILWKISNR